MLLNNLKKNTTHNTNTDTGYLLKTLIITLAFIFISACGGGGGSSTDETPGNNQTDCEKNPSDPSCTDPGTTVDKIVNSKLTATGNNPQIVKLPYESPSTAMFTATITESFDLSKGHEYGKYDITTKAWAKAPDSFSDRSLDSFIKIGEDYFYNHIDGKSFDSFLISADKMRVVSLSNNLFLKFSDIINSSGTNNETALYKSAQDSFKGLTFTGLALVRFANGPFRYNYEETGGTPTNSIDTAIDKELHKGTFKLSFPEVVNTSNTGTDFYFDVTLDTVAEQNYPEKRTGPNDDNGIWEVAFKYLKTDYFQTSNINLQATVEPGRVKVTPSDISKGQTNISMPIDQINSYFAFDTISKQVAGTIRLYEAYVQTSNPFENRPGTYASETVKYFIDIVFASYGQPCTTNETDCKRAKILN